MHLNVIIKRSNQDHIKVPLSFPNNITVQGLRNEVKNTLGYNTQQCLVVANGRILKESSQQLSSYGLVDGNTVAFVNASKRRKHITDDIPVCLGTLSYTSKADEKPEKICSTLCEILGGKDTKHSVGDYQPLKTLLKLQDVFETNEDEDEALGKALQRTCSVLENTQQILNDLAKQIAEKKRPRPQFTNSALSLCQRAATELGLTASSLQDFLEPNSAFTISSSAGALQIHSCTLSTTNAARGKDQLSEPKLVLCRGINCSVILPREILDKTEIHDHTAIMFKSFSWALSVTVEVILRSLSSAAVVIRRPLARLHHTLQALSDAGVVVNELMSSGKIVTDNLDLYPQGEETWEEQQNSFFRRVLEKSNSEHLVLVGEAPAPASEEVQRNRYITDLLKTEDKGTELAKNLPIRLFCLYQADTFPQEFNVAVSRLHPSIISQ